MEEREEEEEISWDEFDQISSLIFSLFSSLDTFFVDRRLPLDLCHHHGVQGTPFPPLDAPSIFTVFLSVFVFYLFLGMCSESKTKFTAKTPRSTLMLPWFVARVVCVCKLSLLQRPTLTTTKRLVRSLNRLNHRRQTSQCTWTNHVELVWILTLGPLAWRVFGGPSRCKQLACLRSEARQSSSINNTGR